MSTAASVAQDWAPLGEEIANSVSHGAGLLAALIAAPFLIVHAARHRDAGFLVGAVLFAASMTLLYLASTLYHALPPGNGKGVFQVLEHSAIFILIAGTYTPFTLGVLRGPLGWGLLAVVWTLATAGVVLKSVNGIAYPALSTALYMLLGWVAVAALPPIMARLPRRGLLWLVAGGLSYSIGVVFFVTDKMVPFGHLVWHLFVIAGTACHFVAVFRYAAARPYPKSRDIPLPAGA